jgi:epoxyqueuosine reductase
MVQAAPTRDLDALARSIRAWGRELGFQAVGIADVDLGPTASRLSEWLARGFHGEMTYMARHGVTRARPAELVPGTVRVISARIDYLPDAAPGESVLADREKAYVSRYALGRDYHKVLRAAPEARRPHHDRCRRVRLPGVHRLGPGDGGRARR